MPKTNAQKAAAAKKTAKVVKQAVNTKKYKKRTNSHFFRPTTKTQARCPKASMPKREIPKMDHFRIIRKPVTTESAMKKIEENNTIVFEVDLTAKKSQIKAAVKKLYDVMVVRVNTLIRPNGTKKAYVRLTADYDALDVANKIGII